MKLRIGLLALMLGWLPFALSADLSADLGADLSVETGGGEFADLLDDEPEFLKVDQAFVLDADMADDGSLVARWEIADGYYLYRHRFEFKARPDAGVQVAAAEIPPGKSKYDDYFGDVEVYYHEATARVPVTVDPDVSGPHEVGVSYQGCADAGLCYPPEIKWLTFAELPASGGPVSAGADVAAGTGVTSPPDSAAIAAGMTEEQTLAGLLSSGTLLTGLLLFFLGGVGLAFTPCVLPMVPILSSIIVGESDSLTRSRAFTLSAAYVLGMAVTYALLGVIVGLFGASMNLQAALQSPPVLVGFALVFGALALSMFGFYELQMPQGLQNRLNALSSGQQGGKHLSVVVMGAISSLVVSPCVSAPLAGALIYISSTGDAVLGGTALLALGLGMGLPLLIIGSSGGHLLPRAGVWMDNVKAVFGVLLLAVAVWLLERVLPGSVTLVLWAALAIGSGVYLGALDFAPRQGWGQLWKATGAFGFIYGVLLLIGAASGAEDPLKPLRGIGAGMAQSGSAEESLDWRPVKGLDGLQVELRAAAEQGQLVMLDFYADWCISCKVMERNVFPADGVRERLGALRLLRADVTDNDDADQALLSAYELFGPPSMVFFAPDGREITEFRVMGELDKKAMKTHLQRLSDWSLNRNVVEKPINVGEIAVN